MTTPTTPRHIRDLSLRFALTALSTAATVHAQPPQPRVIYTDSHAPAGGNGAAWSTAFRDLQDALAAAAADPNRVSQGIEIRLSQGVYTPDRGTLDRNASFPLVSGITLMGGFAGLLGATPDQRDPGQFVSVLSGDLAHNDGPNFANYSDNSRCIVNASNSSLGGIDGLEISGGNADPAFVPGPRGVVAALALNPTLTNRYGRIAFINNCRIVRNRATTVPVLQLSTSSLEKTDISGNWTQDQPIILAQPTTFSLCTIRGNRSTVLNPNGTAGTIRLTSSGSQPLTRFSQCLIADNVSDGNGAIFALNEMTLQLSSCTVCANSAAHSEAIVLNSSMLKLRNCIIARNVYAAAPPAASQIATSSPLTLDIDISVLIDNGSPGVRFTGSPATPGPYLSGDPMFVAPAGADNDPATWQDNDYHLRSGSPAVDRGNATDPLFGPGFADLDGLGLYDDPATTNFGFGAVTYADLGCYEFHRHFSGDFDGNGSITVADIFRFLTAWFAGDPSADYDGGGISVSDIFAFLALWFQGH